MKGTKSITGEYRAVTTADKLIEHTANVHCLDEKYQHKLAI